MAQAWCLLLAFGTILPSALCRLLRDVLPPCRVYSPSLRYAAAWYRTPFGVPLAPERGLDISLTLTSCVWSYRRTWTSAVAFCACFATCCCFAYRRGGRVLCAGTDLRIHHHSFLLERAINARHAVAFSVLSFYAPAACTPCVQRCRTVCVSYFGRTVVFHKLGDGPARFLLDGLVRQTQRLYPHCQPAFSAHHTCATHSHVRCVKPAIPAAIYTPDRVSLDMVERARRGEERVPRTCQQDGGVHCGRCAGDGMRTCGARRCSGAALPPRSVTRRTDDAAPRFCARGTRLPALPCGGAAVHCCWCYAAATNASTYFTTDWYLRTNYAVVLSAGLFGVSRLWFSSLHGTG